VGTDVRVNLGCADRYVDDWVNVDWAGSPHRRDVTLDLARDLLPWNAYTITHAYVGHLLEHIELDDAARMLRGLRDCMVIGGHIMVVGPDVDRARRMILAGTFDSTYHSLDSIVHGDHRWTGTEHRWECTAALVVQLLKDAGWSDVEEVGIENVHGFWPVIDRTQPWQCAVTAVARRSVVA
jgi:predicted SAM-dependent methyltransferase